MKAVNLHFFVYLFTLVKCGGAAQRLWYLWLQVSGRCVWGSWMKSRCEYLLCPSSYCVQCTTKLSAFVPKRCCQCLCFLTLTSRRSQTLAPELMAVNQSIFHWVIKQVHNDYMGWWKTSWGICLQYREQFVLCLVPQGEQQSLDAFTTTFGSHEKIQVKRTAG